MTDVRTLDGTEDEIATLGALLIEAVAGGGGVSFLHPLSPERAREFWWRAFEDASRGKRVIFGSFEGESVVGTVTLLLDLPENQPHRAEIMKMIVAARARRRGHATALLSAAEIAARNHGRSLLVLDTVTQSAASQLYMRAGWVRVGEIPDYALLPDGRPWPATVFYKRLGPLAA
jgi:ribosomal protein S18 acetylase RimI-like enzyme